MDFPATPFTPWTTEEILAAVGRLKALDLSDLLDLAECLSEGWQDLPEDMQGYYRAVKAELAGRLGVGSCSGPT